MPEDNLSADADTSDTNDAVKPAVEKQGLTTALLKLLQGDSQFKATAIVIALLFVTSTVATAYFAWFVILPQLWVWAEGSIGKMVLATFATIILLSAPVYTILLWNELGALLAGVKVNEVRKTKEGLREIEEWTIANIGHPEVVELVTLLRYSRAQLDAYYAMGLQQTRGSYKNAVVAMWLGFLILLAGIYVYIGPVGVVGLRRPDGNFTVVVLASAVIVEVIAALFLYTYRSTVGQLTFYYQLQMSNHAAIQCFSIANGMDEDRDAAKRAVIDRALANSFVLERLELPTSRGLVGLMKP